MNSSGRIFIDDNACLSSEAEIDELEFELDSLDCDYIVDSSSDNNGMESENETESAVKM